MMIQERGHRQVCQICDKTFRQRVIFYEKHIRRHSGEKHFRCASCNKRFTVKGALNKHMKSEHGKLNICLYD